MKNRRYDSLAFAAAAMLLLGVSSAALAQSPSTSSGQNSTSSEESKNMAKHKLESYGLTDLKLKELKHGWSGTAMKDGKPVHVELRENGTVTIK
jgi:ABC-type proline/glycine betaine transport system substrate-binding protein